MKLERLLLDTLAAFVLSALGALVGWLTAPWLVGEALAQTGVSAIVMTSAAAPFWAYAGIAMAAALAPWVAWIGALIEHSSGRPAPALVFALYAALTWCATALWIAARIWWMRSAMEGLDDALSIQPLLSIESLELGDAGIRGAIGASIAVMITAFSRRRRAVREVRGAK